MEQYYAAINSTSLTHHGIKGQKWGIRRYQNKDGTLTPEGQKHKNAYVIANLKARPVQSEAQKLINKDKRLSYDYGGSARNIDDDEYFEYVARSYGLDTEAYLTAMKDYKTFVDNNYKSIKIGEKIIRSLIEQERKE